MFMLDDWETVNGRRCWHFIKKYRYTSDRPGMAVISSPSVEQFIKNKGLDIPFQISIDEYLPGQKHEFNVKFKKIILISLSPILINDKILNANEIYIPDKKYTVFNKKYVLLDDKLHIKKRTLVLSLRYMF